jgi:shikimate kinase
MDNIILIGFMGVGKGTVAREFSKQSGRYAIDTDDLVESLENKKIKKIFEEEGEPYFRDLEKKTAKWLEKSVKQTIISTGGGFYKVKNLKKIGKVVYLQSSFNAIMKRILDHPNALRKLKKRPLLADKDKARALHQERTQEYEAIADITINVENLSPQEIAKRILDAL